MPIYKAISYDDEEREGFGFGGGPHGGGPKKGSGPRKRGRKGPTKRGKKR